MKNTALSLGLGWFGCFPHTLNLVVKDALADPGISEVLGVVRKLASHFKMSGKATNPLKQTQKQLGMKVLRIIRDCETRWSSTYEMLDRYLVIAPAVQSVCILPGYEFPYPDSNTNKELRKINEILKPLASVTKLMSAERNVTASSVSIMENVHMSTK